MDFLFSQELCNVENKFGIQGTFFLLSFSPSYPELTLANENLKEAFREGKIIFLDFFPKMSLRKNFVLGKKVPVGFLKASFYEYEEWRLITMFLWLK